MKNLAKTYNPKDFEDRIYEMWETEGAFDAEVEKDNLLWKIQNANEYNKKNPVTKMKFNAAVGNPPYQLTVIKTETKNDCSFHCNKHFSGLNIFCL